MNVMDDKVGKERREAHFLGAVILTVALIVTGQGQARAAISLVQTANGISTGTIPAQATFPATPTQDNLLVAIAGIRESETISAPSGWSTAINQTGSPGQAIFYKIAGASEPTTVAVSTSGTTRKGLHIYEYSGVNTLDQVSSDTGTGTAVSSGSVTTTSADEAIIAGLVINVEGSFNDASWTNSFTEENDFSNDGVAFLISTYAGADRILSTTGAYSTTVTASLSGAWRGQIASFKLVSVSVSTSTFGFGTRPADSWLTPQSASIINDGGVAENFIVSISQFTDGANTWEITASANGADTIRAQWSTVSDAGPWTDISAYDTDFTTATNVAVNDTVIFRLRIKTPTSTSSYNQYSSTLTVTAQEY